MTAPLPRLDAAITDTALQAAHAAGAVARRAFLAAREVAIPVEAKAGFFDIVTAADREAEAEARRVILDRVPSSRILGEEGGWAGAGEVEWFIDPIDGTSNFASGLPFFCVSIAAYHAGAPVCGVVFDPIRDETFLAAGGRLTLNGHEVPASGRRLGPHEIELVTNAPYEGSRPGPDALGEFARLVDSFRAVRRLGSCALHLAYVAVGRVGACYESKFWAWDIAAGLQLVAAGGGGMLLRGAQGEPLRIRAADLERIRRFVVSAPAFDCAASDLPGLIDRGTL